MTYYNSFINPIIGDNPTNQLTWVHSDIPNNIIQI